MASFFHNIHDNYYYYVLYHFFGVSQRRNTSIKPQAQEANNAEQASKECRPILSPIATLTFIHNHKTKLFNQSFLVSTRHRGRTTIHHSSMSRRRRMHFATRTTKFRRQCKLPTPHLGTIFRRRTQIRFIHMLIFMC